MPRSVTHLSREFGLAAARSTQLAVAGEEARVIAARYSRRQPLRVARLELLYEMAYLRAFLEWESFLEQSFIRYMCGYNSSIGNMTTLNGTYYPNILSAENAILGGRMYKTWHNPNDVIKRVRGFGLNSIHELVLSSNLTRLERFAAIRHRIAHEQNHARREFEQATMSLAARRYRGARPGKFLRDWTANTTPPVRWLETIVGELVGLAGQIAP